MGLAPTLDQIIQLIDDEKFNPEYMGTLVAALVDCKIGRADVPNARYGDRRFAFAHRRYQESLFVRYITKNPDHIPNEEFLLDPRWREYAVTLLQTQSMAYLQPVINTAITILNGERENCAAMKCTSIFDERCSYFEWSNEKVNNLLELLQEGLKKRINDVPAELSKAVYDILRPRWEEGDSFDRTQVLRMGALLPALTLTKYLTRAFKSGTDKMKEFAFLQTPYMRSSPSNFLKKSVLRRLSDEVIGATSKGKLNKLDALSSRLPKDFGSNFVVARSLFVRKIVIKEIGAGGLLLWPASFLIIFMMIVVFYKDKLSIFYFFPYVFTTIIILMFFILFFIKNILLLGGCFSIKNYMNLSNISKVKLIRFIAIFIEVLSPFFIVIPSYFLSYFIYTIFVNNLNIFNVDLLVVNFALVCIVFYCELAYAEIKPWYIEIYFIKKIIRAFDDGFLDAVNNIKKPNSLRAILLERKASVADLKINRSLDIWLLTGLRIKDIVPPASGLDERGCVNHSLIQDCLNILESARIESQRLSSK